MIDQDMAKKLAEGVSGLLANGVFDDLSKDVHFHELSQSRLGYGADVKLADSLVSELRAKGLAKPSEGWCVHTAETDRCVVKEAGRDSSTAHIPQPRDPRFPRRLSTAPGAVQGGVQPVVGGDRRPSRNLPPHHTTLEVQGRAGPTWLIRRRCLIWPTTWAWAISSPSGASSAKPGTNCPARLGAPVGLRECSGPMRRLGARYPGGDRHVDDAAAARG